MSKNVANNAATFTAKSNNYRHEALHKLSNGRLAVLEETSQGSYVIANDAKGLQAGEMLLQYPSASIALDPAYRHSHCGFCAKQVSPSQTLPCSNCFVITACTSCQQQGAMEWHTSSGECSLLQCLADSFCRIFFSDFQGMDSRQAAVQVESIYIITVRLVHRRHSTTLPCPLPEIDWDLFDLLYSSPLPPQASSESNLVVTAMTNLLQMMNAQIQQQQCTTQQPPRPLNPQECLSVWNKCRGCCHAITDFTKPLGEQSLGMALFIPHSFYNHGCAPNAFLSCMLPPPSNSLHLAGAAAAAANRDGGGAFCAAVMARVVSLKSLTKDEPILLSYIPLSGLCRIERQMRLEESYDFMCDCLICHRDDDNGSSSSTTQTTTGTAKAYALEQAVGGGEFASNNKNGDQVKQILGPLRELQIECHQNLRAAAEVMAEEGGEGDSTRTTDCLEQTIATLQMAQRGIQRNQIPASHEVTLECHRLLAVAYSLLGDHNQELVHHDKFLTAAAAARQLMDPSALALQHRLAAQCLEAQLQRRLMKEDDDAKSGKNSRQEEIKKQRDIHFNEAVRIATTTLGEDHPVVLSFKVPLSSNGECDASSKSDSSNKKRKLDQEGK